MVFTRIKNILFEKFQTIFYIFVLSCAVYLVSQFYDTILTTQLTIWTGNRNSTKNITSSYWLTPTKENKIDQISLYYRQVTSARNSSYPYISGDTFRGFSDYVYDETRHDNLSSVKYGDIVFLKTDFLSSFFAAPFNSIHNPFVLVTHNSDYNAPLTYKTHLSNPKILMWYASNPSERNHSKLFPIPIGLASTRWAVGNLDKISYAYKTHRKPWSQRTSLLYVNFAVSTNVAQRQKALDQASKIENAQIIKKRITFDTYLEQIGNAKFVLSPPGNGLDCHRTWEAFLMGAVPIVLTSNLDPLFAKTRSVIIENWSKLTSNLLLSFNFSSNDHLIPDVLSAHYWRETLYKHRNHSFIA